MSWFQIGQAQNEIYQGSAKDVLRTYTLFTPAPPYRDWSSSSSSIKEIDTKSTILVHLQSTLEIC